MTQHPCRCETCTDDKCGYSPVENPNDVRSKDIDLLRGSSFWFVTRIKGCLSHPLAREYLNKEVIKELDRLKKYYHSESEEYAEIGDKPLEERLWGEFLGIEEAHALIKNGVTSK